MTTVTVSPPVAWSLAVLMISGVRTSTRTVLAASNVTLLMSVALARIRTLFGAST